MASLSIPAGMTEKEYFETVASEADFLKWYKEQDLPTYETQVSQRTWWLTVLLKASSSS